MFKLMDEITKARYRVSSYGTQLVIALSVCELMIKFSFMGLATDLSEKIRDGSTIGWGMGGILFLFLPVLVISFTLAFVFYSYYKKWLNRLKVLEGK